MGLMLSYKIGLNQDKIAKKLDFSHSWDFFVLGLDFMSKVC
jgi:hypothetical protein